MPDSSNPAPPNPPNPPNLSISEQSRQIAEQGRILAEQGRALGEKGRLLGEQARKQAAEELARQSKSLAESIPNGGSPGDQEIQEQTRQLTERINKKVADAMARANRDSATSATVEVDGGGRTSRSSRHSGSSGDIPVFAVPIVAIVCVFGYLIIRTLMAPFTGRAAARNRAATIATGLPQAGLSAEELALLEKMQTTLARMESRVEALETILIDPKRRSAASSIAAYEKKL